MKYDYVVIGPLEILAYTAKNILIENMYGSEVWLPRGQVRMAPENPETPWQELHIYDAERNGIYAIVKLAIPQWLSKARSVL